MSISARPVKGTRDFLPEEMRIRDAMQDIILRNYLENGFSKIQTPILEDIDRLDKSEGGENLNLLFKILKRGQKLDLKKEDLTENDLVDMGLRFDLTLPLSRYFINNRGHLRIPFKVIQIGQVFRAERPQKGRLREFYQCDIDIIGEPTVNGEIELVHTAAKALTELGFDEFTVRINDRKILFDLIESAGFKKEDVFSVCITFDKLDKVGIEGVENELLEKGYSKDIINKFIEIISDKEALDIHGIEKYCSDKDAIMQLQKIIDSVVELAKGKYNIEYDKSLVRGMGYYTGTIFEIVSPEFKGSIAGGGRYDKMVGSIVGEDIPAVGISIGFERISEILLNSKSLKFDIGRKKMALLYDEEDSFVDVVKNADELRETGYDVSTIRKIKKVGRQFAALQREGYEAALIYGETEIKDLSISERK